MKKLVILSLLLLSACGPKPPMHHGESRQITVNGLGSVQSVPDRFNFTVVVEERGESASELNKRVSDKTKQVVSLLTELKVEPKNIQSLQVQFNPWIEYNDNTQEQKGFILSRQIQISLDDLTLYDQAIDSVLQLKINRIEGFSYSNSKGAAHYQDAIKYALLDAQTRASHMAETLGLKLGKAISISEQSQGQPVMREKIYSTRARMASDSMPGQMDTEAQVAVVFELLN
ncbi:SIMPL domain-containing protein [Paraglaciecola hydrolytica]|uniref:SIMPL domain-containing protein n=1 Tax=Paraglaciecola hydrolytica TaxID=1799789 RepID=A0A136A1D3_9ALTE|nr:SIMPL domain-containing protein [Paraglaciecola hydrolytica]KXI29042.1 hypothetical protein AX660_12815 [Paraglaciecola hydrolytica]